MTKKLISFDDEKPGLGLPDAVTERLDGRYSQVDPTYGLVPRLVYHDTNPGTPRPDTDGPVIWLGVPMPAHSQPGDVLLRPAGSEADWAPDWLDLLGWYDSSTLTPGSTVTYVEDRSGHANHLTTLGGTGDITVGTTDLAHPGFRFNGDSWITSGVLPAGAWRHPTTVYLVANVEDQKVPAQTLIDGTTNSTRFALWKTQTRLLGMRQTVGVTSGTTAFTAGPHLIAGVFSGDGQSRGEIDGTVVLGPADVGTATPSAIRLGGSFQDINGVFGSIGEVIIARDVSPEDHQQVTDYLMQKWGIV